MVYEALEEKNNNTSKVEYTDILKDIFSKAGNRHLEMLFDFIKEYNEYRSSKTKDFDREYELLKKY